jgi:RimJ/RimL family protein N-acetyltransferase
VRRLEYAKSKYTPRKITLSVANFNQRAIKVYRKIGFEEVDTFMQDTNESDFEFFYFTFITFFCLCDCTLGNDGFVGFYRIDDIIFLDRIASFKEGFNKVIYLKFFFISKVLECFV